jgi:hypothetical protein
VKDANGVEREVDTTCFGHRRMRMSAAKPTDVLRQSFIFNGGGGAL